MSGRFSRTIYVGNLPADIREYEVEDLFCKYGRIAAIELKIPPRPPAYCFVEFYNAEAAEMAINSRDGFIFNDSRLRVELAHGGRGPISSERHPYLGGGTGNNRYSTSRRAHYRVIVRGLPPSASWQDLKDHMRRAGDVCFADVSRDSDGTFGLVDYTTYEGMKYAVRKLNDTEFRNPWTRSYIRVIQCERTSARYRSRSLSRSRSRSYGRNRSWSRSRSRSRNRSRSRSRSWISQSWGRSRILRNQRSVSRSTSKSRSPSPVKPYRARSQSRSESRSRLPSGSRSKSISD